MITAIIPTLNEESCIGGAIRSVSFADEVIVIDSFSTDGTLEIAEKNGAKVIQREFDDFSSQKNYAIEQASYNWIFVLDADERIGKDLAREISDLVKNENDYVGYYVYRNFYFMGKKISYGGWQTDKVLRLFKKDKCRYNGNLVHELIEFEGKVSFLENKMEHYSYRNSDHYLAKLNHYAALQARELYEEGKKMHLFFMVFKPPFRFFVHYFIRLGFLDGIPGLVLAYQHAFGIWARYTNLWQLYQAEKSSVST